MDSATWCRMAAAASAARRLRPEVWKNSSTALSSNEGEYYPSEISGGHDVVITWLKFSVDGHPYYFRTFYQFQPDNNDDIAAGIKSALRMSIQGIAPRIQL